MPPRSERRPPSKAQLYGLLGVMLVLWSANWIFAKIALRDAPAVLVGCLRTVLSGLLMVPVYGFARRRADPALRPVTARDLPRMAAIGVLGIVGNQFLFVIAISLTSVAHGSVVAATSPVLVLLGAVALGMERLKVRRVLGMLTAVAGVAVLQFVRAPGGQASLVGDALMLCNAAVFAVFSLLSGRLTTEVGTTAVNAVAFWGGAVVTLPFAIWGLAQVGPDRIGFAAWVAILYMALAPSIVGYLIYSHALRYLPASGVAGVTYLQPVLATFLAVALLGERPGLAYLGSAVVILGGVWLVQKR